MEIIEREFTQCYLNKDYMQLKYNLEVPHDRVEEVKEKIQAIIDND